MKEYRDDNRFNRPKRRKKPKRYTFLFCCLALVILAVGVIIKQFSFTIFDTGTEMYAQSRSIDDTDRASV